MTAPVRTFVPTRLGRLHVRRFGDGPAAVLWHSLFVDSRTWDSVVGALSRYRTVYAIDGPSHGESDSCRHNFTFAECVGAALDALDGVGLDQPVDWVGNAWGGHLGINIAATHPARLRTLTTIGTPVQAFTLWEKLTKGWPLVEMYRFAGATGFLVDQLANALLGAETIAAEPDRSAVVIDSFRSAECTGMVHAIRSMMMRRAGVEALLPRIAVPTLVMSVRDDVMGWRPDEARATCTAIPDCRVEEVDGTGHVSPLLIDADRIALLLGQFWAE